MTTDPRTLRSGLRAQRQAIAPGERISGADALARQLLALPFATAHGPVAGYWAMDGEIALHAWQLALPAQTTYCLPILGDDARLRFAPWRPGAPLVSNRFGIPEPDVDRSAWLEPEEMHMVVVPLVGFDDARNRLGMGGGWYDRSFAFRRSTAAPPFLVGAGFDLQQLSAAPSREWDVRMDAICTPTTTWLDRGDAA